MLFLFMPFLPISSLLLPFFLQIRGRLVITDEMLGEGHGPITTASAILLKKPLLRTNNYSHLHFPLYRIVHLVTYYKLLVFLNCLIPAMMLISNYM